MRIILLDILKKLLISLNPETFLVIPHELNVRKIRNVNIFMSAQYIAFADVIKDWLNRVL